MKPKATDSSPATAAPYAVLARRYRSQTFAEVIGQEWIARTLSNSISQGRTAHAYLFCGTRGVGKTSMARIFARELNAVPELQEREAVAAAILRGGDVDVIEIDGASNRGVDDARDLIASAAITPARSPYRIYIIDEVHMLTQPAFNALLKTMEEPPSHVKFILCTTEAHKVPATIQSRCQRFDFRNIPTARIAEHLAVVLKTEKISAEAAVVTQVARLANGSMRDGLSLMERLVAAAGTEPLSSQIARQVLGIPPDEALDELLGSIVGGDAAGGLRLAAALLDQGMSEDHALELLASRVRDAMVASACGAASELVELPLESRENLARLVAGVPVEELVHWIALCDSAGRNCRSSSMPRTVFDAVVARLCLHEKFAQARDVLAGNAKPAAPSAPAPPRSALPNRTALPVAAAPQPVASARAAPSAAAPQPVAPPRDAPAAAPRAVPEAAARPAGPSAKPAGPRHDPALAAAAAKIPMVKQVMDTFDATIVRAYRKSGGAESPQS